MRQILRNAKVAPTIVRLSDFTEKANCWTNGEDAAIEDTLF